MTDTVIEHKDNAQRYSLWQDGHEAYLTYQDRGDGTRIITHTIVPDQLGGQGLGKMLVKRAVEDAIDDGLKLASSCWFATGLIEKTPDWRKHLLA